MTEILATIDPVFPSGYEKLDGIEIVEHRYNGLIELGEGEHKILRRVPLPDLAEMWGYDAEQSEAEWPKKLSDSESLEVMALRAQVEELETQLDQEKGRHIAEIQSLREEFQQQLAQRDEKINELRTEIDELKEGTVPPPAKTVWLKDSRGRRTLLEEGFWVRNPQPNPRQAEPKVTRAEIGDEEPEEVAGFEEGEIVALQQADGSYKRGYEVKGFTKDNGHDRIIIQPVGTPGEEGQLSVTPEEIKYQGEVTEEDLAPRVVRLRQTPRLDSLPPAADSQSPAEDRVVTEETVWYRRGRTPVILGGLAAVAAAVGVAYLWGEHEENEHAEHQPVPTIVHSPRADIENNSQASASLLESSGYHLTYYNQEKNRHVTGVWLPNQLKLKGSPGNYSITNSRGAVLVQKAQWDSQGKLSSGNIKQLKAKYNIAWDRLKNGRYVTVVASR